MRVVTEECSPFPSLKSIKRSRVCFTAAEIAALKRVHALAERARELTGDDDGCWALLDCWTLEALNQIQCDDVRPRKAGA